MLVNAVAKRYANALFAVAQEQNNIDEIESDLAFVVSTLDGHPQFRRILQHPAISAAEKKKQVGELFGKAVSASVLNFLYLLLDRGRESELNGIYEQYVSLADSTRGRVKAHIETARSLPNDELKALEEKLGAQCGLKMELSSSVNEDLIAGARLKMGDRIIDASVKGQLDRFHQSFKRKEIR